MIEIMKFMLALTISLLCLLFIIGMIKGIVKALRKPKEE